MKKQEKKQVIAMAVVEIEENIFELKKFRKLGIAKRQEKDVKTFTQVFGSIWEITTNDGSFYYACNTKYSHKTKYSHEWIKKGGKVEYYEQIHPSLWGWSTEFPEKQKYIEFNGYTSEEIKKGIDKKGSPHKMERRCKKIIEVKRNIFICELERHQLAVIQVTP